MVLHLTFVRLMEHLESLWLGRYLSLCPDAMQTRVKMATLHVLCTIGRFVQVFNGNCQGNKWTSPFNQKLAAEIAHIVPQSSNTSFSSSYFPSSVPL